MALPAGLRAMGSFRGRDGDKGNTGTLAFATAESVPADQPAAVEMVGPESNRGAHFSVPRGLPGVLALDNDAAVAGYIDAEDSATRTRLDGAFGWSLLVTDDRFGAIGDGVTNCTAAIQAAVDYAYSMGGATVVVPPGVYMVNADAGVSVWTDAGGIRMRDGVTLWISAGATIRALPVTTTVSRVIRVFDCDNVTITGGGTVDGNRSNAVVTTGEWGYGVAINAGSNILVEKIRTINCWGDGVNIQRLGQSNYTAPVNVTVRGIESHNNRRQGCSVESGWNVLIENNLFSGTNGTLPTCGLDIEPADANGTIDFLVVRNNRFTANARAGLQLWETSKAHNVTIEDNEFDGNGSQGPVPQMRIVDAGNGLHVRGNTFKNTLADIAASIAGPARDGIVAENHLDRDLEITGTAIIPGFPKDMSVTGNTILNGTLRFSYMLGFTIDKNYIRPVAGKPCIDFAGAGSAQNGRIRGNYFEGGTKGIFGNQTNAMSFITIRDNIFQHQTEQAIYLKGGDSISIVENTFEGCCLTTGASIITDVADGSGAVRRRIEKNTFKVAPRSGGPTATNTPTSCYSSAAVVQASSVIENVKIGTIDMFPTTQATGGGTVFADLGRVPARASTYRPTSPPNGTMMMDLTLGIPIWYRNTAWVNHAGSVV